jgi:glycosyltransferase involved in cell wall biosynthesis/2-polyprenyl-3-methyl-5-hydroxy-6-metoxy-1,4-benzoquinol methylase
VTIAFFIQSVQFTKPVLSGEASLGGSESACVGLARALVARGHRVHIFTPLIDDDALGPDHAGVEWHHSDDIAAMNLFTEWDVFCALRMFTAFGVMPIKARLRLLWNQDLLTGENMKNQVMSVSWAFDKSIYVSAFHRWQWEDLTPDLKGLGWVTKNGYDPSMVPTDVVKRPNQIIHISRPERGLTPLLQLWPRLKAERPDAELLIARYSSMYDKEGWGKVCASYDEQCDAVNRAVGGVRLLGELGKPALYRALAESAVLWYPGVVGFAETSCIAAIEAQANGTPLVASYKGALPETAAPADRAGHLIRGDAQRDEAYAQQSVAAVVSLLDGCKNTTRAYRDLQDAGRAHVAPYTYTAIADTWEAQIETWFRERYQTQKAGVLRQLLQEDDHVAARLVAAELVESGDPEAAQALAFCDRVIAGQDQTSEQYADAAIDDPIQEGEGVRFSMVAKHFAGHRRVLDVACGNGALALKLARTDPDVQVVGVDYAAKNIARARLGASAQACDARVSFQTLSVYDFDRQAVTAEFQAFVNAHRGEFDGVFIGEFLEHTAAYHAVIEAAETAAAPGATIVITVPHGPLSELLQRGTEVHRGHVHRFAADDVMAVFGQKAQRDVAYFGWGVSSRGNPVGQWIIRYRHEGKPTGLRPVKDRIIKTRPKQRLTVGLIAKNAEHDLGRCLEPLWPIADEIIVGDTGSTDRTVEVARSFGARVLTLPTVQEHPQGFAGVRNAVLEAATGEWFLWIDADEVILNPTALRYYIESGGPMRGFAIHQNHLYLDMPPTYDRPVRLFRRDPGIKFYGCVHEQPQDGDANTDIQPALELNDVQIAHTGYLTEPIRRDKMLTRNLPLLRKDAQVFPERRLGAVLRLRDYINLADYERERHRGQMTDYAQQCYAEAIALWDAYFTDPTDKHHAIARPFYEKAVQARGGWEMGLALAGRYGGIGKDQSVGIKRIWVRTADEFKRYVDAEVAKVHGDMAPPPMKVDPDLMRAEVSA